MKKELIKENSNYYYQVLGKRPIKPTVRVVKDKPFYPELEEELFCTVDWKFSVFGGSSFITVNDRTTITDILNAIRKSSFLFSDTTYVESIVLDTDELKITVKLTQIGTV